MEQAFNRMGKLGFGMLGSAFFIQKFLFVVNPGEACLVQNNISGLKETPYYEGMHFRVPLRDNIKRFDIRTRPILVSCSSATKDMQNTTLVMRVLFHPEDTKLSTILLTLGADYDTRLIPQISQEVLKTTAAQYTAEQLIGLREKVSKEIKEVLLKRAAELNIIIDDISLTDL